MKKLVKFGAPLLAALLLLCLGVWGFVKGRASASEPGTEGTTVAEETGSETPAPATEGTTVTDETKTVTPAPAAPGGHASASEPGTEETTVAEETGSETPAPATEGTTVTEETETVAPAPAAPGGHAHGPAEAANTVPAPRYATCGNTECEMTAFGKEYRFMYSPSVFFFDLLNNLDYSEPACDCAADFTVTPEFSPTYAISLEGCFVRCEKGQCALTSAQRDALEKVRDVVIRADGRVSAWDAVPEDFWQFFDFGE